MVLILGVDPSAQKIAVVGCETVTQTFHVRAGKVYPKGVTKQTAAALGNSLSFMRDLLQELALIAPEGQRFAFVEAPLVGRGGTNATIKQAYVGGIIRGCLAEAGFAVYDVHPSTWRSTLGIKARTTAAVKTATQQVVGVRWSKVYGEVKHDADLVDAAAICLHGQEQVRKAVGHLPAGPARGSVPGSGPRKVVRPSRLRSGL